MFTKYEKATNWCDFLGLAIIMVALGLITYGDELEKKKKKKKTKGGAAGAGDIQGGYAPLKGDEDYADYADASLDDQLSAQVSAPARTRAHTRDEARSAAAMARSHSVAAIQYSITPLGEFIRESFNLSARSEGYSTDAGSVIGFRPTNESRGGSAVARAKIAREGYSTDAGSGIGFRPTNESGGGSAVARAKIAGGSGTTAV